MAIDELLDEHEQSERVRSWVRSNAAGMIGGVLLGLALIGGWRWWQQRQETARAATGDQYQAVADAVEARQLDAAAAKAKGLPAEGVYAAMAAMDVAAAQVDAGKRDAAIETLKNVRTTDPGLRQVVAQRLARLYLDAGKPGEAGALVRDMQDAAGLEIQGDAAFAAGKLADAQRAYQQALAQLDVAAPQRRLVELKLTQAGGTPPTNQPRT